MSARATKEVSNNPNFCGVKKATVRQFVQTKTAFNLQHIDKLIVDSQCSAYSIAFDAPTVRLGWYLDVRVQI